MEETELRGAITILNVDDDAQGRAYKTTVLEQAGFAVSEAANAEQALQLAMSTDVSLVLLDVMLPGLDGFYVCQQLKDNLSTRSIPIVLISGACVTDEDWARGLDVGADHYLMTPVSDSVLVKTICALLRRYTLDKTRAEVHRQAYEALESSERRYRDLMSNAPYGVYVSAASGEILMANQALATILGFDSAQDLLGCSSAGFYADPDERDWIKREWRRSSERSTHEVRWRRRDDQMAIVRLTRGLARPDNHEPNYEVFVEDVTEARRLEMEALQRRKMEGIGRLAAGIAHDFNNLLTAVLGYTELLLQDSSLSDGTRSDLLEIERAGKSATALTQQLLAFGRKQPLQIGPVDMNRTVQNCEQLLRRLIGADIVVTVQLSQSLPFIRADVTQLEQVFLNLAVNARDAMKDGGRLTITTDLIELPDADILPIDVPAPHGQYVRVRFTDTGCGMDADTKQHLFEPFFTTKEMGRGTGLGLASAYGVVKQLEGFIWVRSEVGQGATFSLIFPPLQRFDAASSALAGDRSTPAKQKTILIVEDDASVRMFGANVLRRHGYHVLETETPAAALSLVAKEQSTIDAVISDVIMPGMNGPAFIAKLKSIRDIPALFMSGYADMSVIESISDGDIPLLPKPFSRSSLLEAVRLIVEQPNPQTDVETAASVVKNVHGRDCSDR